MLVSNEGVGGSGRFHRPCIDRRSNLCCAVDWEGFVVSSLFAFNLLIRLGLVMTGNSYLNWPSWAHAVAYAEPTKLAEFCADGADRSTAVTNWAMKEKIPVNRTRPAMKMRPKGSATLVEANSPVGRCVKRDPKVAVVDRLLNCHRCYRVNLQTRGCCGSQRPAYRHRPF